MIFNHYHLYATGDGITNFACEYLRKVHGKNGRKRKKQQRDIANFERYISAKHLEIQILETVLESPLEQPLFEVLKAIAKNKARAHL